jgi:hypothetical protein
MIVPWTRGSLNRCERDILSTAHVLIEGSQLSCLQCNITITGVFSYLHQLSMHCGIEILILIVNTERVTIEIEYLRTVTPGTTRERTIYVHK